MLIQRFHSNDKDNNKNDFIDCQHFAAEIQDLGIVVFLLRPDFAFLTAFKFLGSCLKGHRRIKTFSEEVSEEGASYPKCHLCPEQGENINL